MIEPLRESRLAECDECGLLFRVPGLTSQELTTFYRNLPETNWQYDPTRVGSWTCATRLLQRKHAASLPLDIVDVGAYEGAFLKRLPSAWRKYAIEPSPQGQTSLRASGVEVIGEYVESIDDEKECTETFDVVTLFDVFEHLPSPGETLRRLSGLMKPGGRLVLSTGNTDHWSWRLLNGGHWYLHTAQHLCFGNPRYFETWGERHGLEVESIIRHPHKRGSWAARFVHGLGTVHLWSLRERKSLIARLIQSLPGCGDWMHRGNGTVFADSLRDHILVCFRKPVRN